MKITITAKTVITLTIAKVILPVLGSTRVIFNQIRVNHHVAEKKKTCSILTGFFLPAVVAV